MKVESRVTSLHFNDQSKPVSKTPNLSTNIQRMDSSLVKLTACKAQRAWSFNKIWNLNLKFEYLMATTCQICSWWRGSSEIFISLNFNGSTDFVNTYCLNFQWCARHCYKTRTLISKPSCWPCSARSSSNRQWPLHPHQPPTSLFSLLLLNHNLCQHQLLPLPLSRKTETNLLNLLLKNRRMNNWGI